MRYKVKITKTNQANFSAFEVVAGLGFIGALIGGLAWLAHLSSEALKKLYNSSEVVLEKGSWSVIDCYLGGWIPLTKDLPSKELATKVRLQAEEANKLENRTSVDWVGSFNNLNNGTGGAKEKVKPEIYKGVLRVVFNDDLKTKYPNRVELWEHSTSQI